MKTKYNSQITENRETLRKPLLAVLMIVMFTVFAEPLISHGEKADSND